jgi:asparagine synthase (glutamine-hydrolysing)
MGLFQDREQSIYFGHRRLSILELSEKGHQPMVSENERYVIVFNGEIYNHIELRHELKNQNFKWIGGSDTETLLRCFEFWGINGALKKIIGMFSFSLWDRKENTIIIARDRFGEKPLYYSLQNGNFFFSSELKALKKNDLFRAEVDRDSLKIFMRMGYIKAPHSIYKDVFKVEPGTYLTYFLDSNKIKKNIYWSSSENIKFGYQNQFSGDRDEAVNELEKLMLQSIKGQMLSDVPLGAFLSGGIDSSLIVALMQKLSKTQVKTFSIGFKDKELNEAVFAKDVADYIGTDHSELYLSHKDALNMIPEISNIYDEPFADSSQIPTFLVSKLAKQKVTVSLSGDAGDELFGGYNRYLLASRSWRSISNLPLALRSNLSFLLSRISEEKYNKFSSILGKVGYFRGQHNIGGKVHKALRCLPSKNIIELYSNLVSIFPDPNMIVIGGSNSSVNYNYLTSDFEGLEELDFVSQLMAIDTKSYLPGDILCKVDRAAMGVSLETRVPFLDHRIFQFAWSLPLNYKIFKNQSKWVLRELLDKYVPKNLIERPKMGFAIPLDDWLRNDLRDWASSLLNEEKIVRDGYLNPNIITKIWEEHLSKKYNWGSRLWNILVFQMWIENQ